MYELNEAGLTLVNRAIARDGLQRVASRAKVGHVRLRRAYLFGGRLSKEEMGYLAEAIGWPMKYLVK